MRCSTRWLSALLVAALAVACAACGSSTSDSNPSTPAHASGSGFPVAIKAANGTVDIASRPDAIVSLSPTATEMLFAIGAGSQVKAVDSDSDYPPQAPHTSLSAYDPNAEAIAAYKPDLVVISNNEDSIEQQLNKLSIPVLLLPAATDVANVYAQIDELGTATGHLAQAEREDSSIRSQLASIVASVPKHAKPLTYYYEVGYNPYYSITSATFIGSLLSLLGMKSIADSVHGAAADDGYPSLSAEFILKANPDYIILADTGADGGQTATTVDRRPGWSVLAAVKDKHVIALNADIASRWGPRIVDLLRDVAAGIGAGSK